jgi:membrane protease YdiL (CAAX protease family)
MELRGARPRPSALTLVGTAALAAFLFAALFYAHHLGPLDFWWGISANILIMVGLCLAAERGYAHRLKDDARSGPAKKIVLGIISAVVLYAVFAAGNVAVLKLFPFAPAGIAEVYRLKEGAGLLRVILLLALLVGPGEEIFWRGFLQETAGPLFGRGAAFWLTALLYALVHAASGNVILVIAAGVCGLFWGLTYSIFRSPLLNAVSHAVWDLAVFVILPF